MTRERKKKEREGEKEEGEAKVIQRCLLMTDHGSLRKKRSVRLIWLRRQGPLHLRIVCSVLVQAHSGHLFTSSS
jgi:hypothetical protein